MSVFLLYMHILHIYYTRAKSAALVLGAIVLGASVIGAILQYMYYGYVAVWPFTLNNDPT